MKEHDRPENEAPVRAQKPGRKPAPEAAPSVSPNEAADWLNRLLADEFILYTKTLNNHWNVRGMQFSSLHEFFEVLYKQGLQFADDVAERVRTLGGTALGTMDDFLKQTRLKEQAGFPPDPRGMISGMLADHEAICRTLREGVELSEESWNDPGTNNFLTGLLEKHEKTAWMLRAHLDKDLG